MATLQAVPFTFFVSGINWGVVSASQFLLKGLEVNELQSSRLGHPNGVALRVFIE
jgi:hypothetical protein